MHDPKLRESLLTIKAAIEQVIDEVTKDHLLASEFDAVARAKAQSVLADFKQFVADNKDEIEAIKLLYSKPPNSRNTPTPAKSSRKAGRVNILSQPSKIRADCRTCRKSGFGEL